jgi:hypothetical protein
MNFAAYVDGSDIECKDVAVPHVDIFPQVKIAD